MKNICSILLTATLLLVLPARLPAQEKLPDLDTLIAAYEHNQLNDQMSSKASMVINDRFGRRTMAMHLFSSGRDYTLLEFISTAEEGQKILRTPDALYLYYPDAANIIRMQGAALRESMMGSDISYEDMTGGRNMKKDYHITLLGTEENDGIPSYKLELKARTRNQPYPRQILWIHSKHFSLIEIHAFTLNNKLLKRIKVTKTDQIGDKYIPTGMIIEDVIKRNSSTELNIYEIDITTPIDKNVFSLEELSW